MYGLQVVQIIVLDVNTNTEVKPCISSVNNLKITELKQ